MTIKILVNGARGKMGQETVKAVQQTEGLELVGETGRSDDLTAMIKTTQADVVVDFTTAAAAFTNTCTIIAAGARPVIGSSGLVAEQMAELAQRCKEKKLGGIIAPNFSLGGVLMMRYASDCARYFPDVEIIEQHHANKADAPSGTALRTAELIAAAKELAEVSAVPDISHEKFPGVRGGRYQNIPIHSVRLPGLLAHQEVIFGGVGETLTIRHDSFNRISFMPGVCLACHKVMELDHLVVGLEHII